MSWNNGARAPIRARFGVFLKQNSKHTAEPQQDVVALQSESSRTSNHSSRSSDAEDGEILSQAEIQESGNDSQDDVLLIHSLSDSPPKVVRKKRSLTYRDDVRQNLMVTKEPQNHNVMDEAIPDLPVSEPETTIAATTKVILKSLPDSYQELQKIYFSGQKELERDQVNEEVICLVCRKPGHIGHNCSRLTCLACGAYKDHFISSCPDRKVCLRCNNRGHDISECKSKLKVTAGIGERACFVCSSAEHLGAECPQMWRTYDPPEAAMKVDFLPVYCYSCSSRGHYGPDCSLRPMKWTTPKSGLTFSAENLRRYVYDESRSLVPQSTNPPFDHQQRLPSRIEMGHRKSKIDYRDNESEDDDFLRHKITIQRSRGRARPKMNIKSRHMPPPQHPSPSPNRLQDRRLSSHGGRRRSGSPPAFRRHSLDDDERYSTRYDPPLPSGPPQGSGRRGSSFGRGKGRGTSSSESYRPMPSSATKAWRQHRM